MIYIITNMSVIYNGTFCHSQLEEIHFQTVQSCFYCEWLRKSLIFCKTISRGPKGGLFHKRNKNSRINLLSLSHLTCTIPFWKTCCKVGNLIGSLIYDVILYIIAGTTCRAPADLGAYNRKHSGKIPPSSHNIH